MLVHRLVFDEEGRSDHLIALAGQLHGLSGRPFELGHFGPVRVGVFNEDTLAQKVLLHLSQTVGVRVARLLAHPHLVIRQGTDLFRSIIHGS